LQAVKEGKLKTATRIVTIEDDKIVEDSALADPNVTMPKVCNDGFIH